VHKLRGLVMLVSDKKNALGDLFVTVEIQLPEHLTGQETGLFRKLAAVRKWAL
jgi:DnaJ-class molecular chaperone